MADIIVGAILVLLVGGACTYIRKAKKRGQKCIGCSISGSESCHCEKEKV